MSKHDKKDWDQFKKENDAQEDNAAVEPAEELEHQEESLEHLSYEELSEKLTLEEQQSFEYKEKLMRTLAELDNVRRRSEREISNAHRFGNEKLISALLPIVDSLEQAAQMAEKDGNAAMVEGLELTMRLFVDVFQKFDVEQIDPIGLPFDPQEHEAMSMQDAPGTAPNTILAVFQKGYKLNDRVIRPARVIVSKK